MARQQSPKKSCNLFVLRKMEESNKFAPITVDFTPIQKSLHIHENIFPMLNKDHKFYTPCFILQVDQKYCENNDGFQKLKFEQKVQDSQEKPLYMNNLFPIPTITYCQVCKTSFKDYFKHINQQCHQNLTTKSEGNALIHEIVDSHGSQNKLKKIIKKESQKKLRQVERQQNNLRKNIQSKTRAQRWKHNEQPPTQAYIQSQNNT